VHRITHSERCDSYSAATSGPLSAVRDWATLRAYGSAPGLVLVGVAASRRATQNLSRLGDTPTADPAGVLVE